MVYLRTTYTEGGESREGEAKWAIQLTLSQELYQCKEHRTWECRVVEIRKSRRENERNVRGVHCVERGGGRTEGRGSSGIRPLFLILLYWWCNLANHPSVRKQPCQI